MVKRVSHILYSGLGGHSNVFFSFYDADKEKVFDTSAIFYGIERVRDEYEHRCNSENIPFDYVKKKQGLDFCFFWKVFRSLTKSKPDYILLHSSYLIIPVWIYSKLYGVKTILRETQANHLKTSIEWVTLGLSFILLKKIVVLSRFYRDDLKKRLGILYLDKKVTVIPNGIDLDQFRPYTEQKKGNLITVGMVSRLVEIKDHETLIIAFDNLKKKHPEKEIELKIAGEGRTKGKLDELIKKLNNHSIQLIGVLNENELARFLRNLDVYVHASFGETMSTSIMQAQASGLPIIASDVSGINNVIEDGINGKLVEVLNPNSLQKTLEELVENEFERKRLGNESRIYAETNLSSKKMFESYKILFLG